MNSDQAVGSRAPCGGLAAVPCCILAAALLISDVAGAQDQLDRGELTFEATGPGVLFGALDPAVKKWYVPQELFRDYQWKQWEYTNYARNHYERYVDTTLEGVDFYDIYGSHITRGWLIYDWRQAQPEQGGSNLYKTEKFRSYFSDLVIASDQKGQHNLAITVGSSIRSTLTPMTFSKPAFNGIQVDYQSDKYEVTALLSRISAPGGAGPLNPAVNATSSLTSLSGGRATAQVGSYVKVGANYVNAKNSFQLLDAFEGSPRSGSITSSQNAENVRRVYVRLSDDSPDDNEGGASLFAWDLIIEADVESFDESGELIRTRQVVRASDVGLFPAPQGGFQRQGFWEASGSEKIEMQFDLSAPPYSGPDPSQIRKLTFELVVANDYRIEVSSDRQTNRQRSSVFLLAARAEGNVKDGSNLTALKIPYGLPTATEIYGMTIEVSEVGGFHFYGEFDRSTSFRKYPNRQHTSHLGGSDHGDGWLMNLSKVAYPWFLYGEAYSMDQDYNTSATLARGEVNIDYEDKTQFIYEFVEDNDDQDRFPDWQRIYENIDLAVFPGLDENVDFISDFNQNDSKDLPNLVPDYEEPFLRYATDRPEYLFGIDMNNNTWVDRFENDDEPDFPYSRDLRGHNAYVGAHLTPYVRLTAGRTDERQIAGSGSNTTDYVLFSLDRSYAGVGRLRVFENLRLASDNIRNDLRQWDGFERRNVPTLDPLAAQDTWINSSAIGFDYTKTSNLRVSSKVKYDLWHQRKRQPDLRDDLVFLGLINKMAYSVKVGNVQVQPKVKNELRIESPALKSAPKRNENSLLFLMLARWPVLTYSSMEAGVEYTIFRQFRNSEVATKAGLLDDFNEIVGAAQFSSRTSYLGYRLITHMGLKVTRRSIGGKSETGKVAYATIYSGLE